MSAFSGQFDWASGLIWKVVFIPSNAERPEPKPAHLHLCDALVDTGASQTSIAKSVAKELGLQPSGKTKLQTAGGSVNANIYDVKLGFLFPGRMDGAGSTATQIQVMDKVIRAPEFDPGSTQIQALIGRDVLSAGVLCLSYDGHFSFSY